VAFFFLGRKLRPEVSAVGGVGPAAVGGGFWGAGRGSAVGGARGDVVGSERAACVATGPGAVGCARPRRMRLACFLVGEGGGSSICER